MIGLEIFGHVVHVVRSVRRKRGSSTLDTQCVWVALSTSLLRIKKCYELCVYEDVVYWHLIFRLHMNRSIYIFINR